MTEYPFDRVPMPQSLMDKVNVGRELKIVELYGIVRKENVGDVTEDTFMELVRIIDSIDRGDIKPSNIMDL